MTPEYEQYCIGQAEAWLEKVRRCVMYARQLDETAAAQYALADGLKALDYSRDHVSTSPTADAIPNAVIAHLSAGDSLAAIAEDAKRRSLDAVSTLACMPDRSEARCLTLYYVDALATWVMVAESMGFNYDKVMRLRRSALYHVYDYMPFAEREPTQPAI